MRFYHYNCGTFKDAGWGCCYRSYQNAMLLHGQNVDMESLVALFGEGQWIEPAMLANILPTGYRQRSLLWFQKPEALHHMKYTKPEDYQILIPCNKITETLTRLARTATFIIDDGVFAYCLFYSNGWVILDPHTIQQQNVLIRLPSLLEWLVKSELWMILAVEPL